MPAITFAVYLGMNWWASWYPGAEPGGGGYIAQRIFSARSEKDGVLATLWFNVAHYAVRPWPWILVALCSTVLYRDLDNPRQGYVMAIMDLLPSGLTGLLLAGLAAAYMSTISDATELGRQLSRERPLRALHADGCRGQTSGRSLKGCYGSIDARFAGRHLLHDLH